jgi:hypothetical protein
MQWLFFFLKVRIGHIIYLMNLNSREIRTWLFQGTCSFDVRIRHRRCLLLEIVELFGNQLTFLLLFPSPPCFFEYIFLWTINYKGWGWDLKNRSISLLNLGSQLTGVKLLVNHNLNICLINFFSVTPLQGNRERFFFRIAKELIIELNNNSFWYL